MAGLLFKTSESRDLARNFKELSYSNPFSAQRIALEKKILGSHYITETTREAVYFDGERIKLENVSAMTVKAKRILDECKTTLKKIDHSKITAEEAEEYESIVLFYAYYLCRDHFFDYMLGQKKGPLKFYDEFKGFISEYLLNTKIRFPLDVSPAHLFAFAYQLYRAFYHIYFVLYGPSKPMEKLRERVWESSFTQEMRFFWRSMYKQMNQMATLITGPSGTGKELVARAIGLGIYVPFNEDRKEFVTSMNDHFQAINLSAISPTLIESELFGHKKGSFTGAIADRSGWLEKSGNFHSIFLDEVGELDPSIQVKLLRLLQSREFQKIGENKTLRFNGKIIAATNRDLAHEIREGRFREDFYYRLCSDLVQMPSLRERIQDNHQELDVLVTRISERILGETDRKLIEDFADRKLRWIRRNLGKDYAWPGNVRELEQCLRNLLVHGGYNPQAHSLSSNMDQQLLEKGWNLEQLTNYYVNLVYSQTQNFEQTGRRLGLDRRTVKKHIQSK